MTILKSPISPPLRNPVRPESDETVAPVSPGVPQLVFSGGSIAENTPVGTFIGLMSVSNSTANWSLTKIGGSTRISLLGDQVQIAQPLNFEARGSEQIVVRASAGGDEIVETFTITVTDVFYPIRAPPTPRVGGGL